MIKRRLRNDSEEKPTRFFSNKQEKAVAKSLGGRQQPNSGATPFCKSDIVLDDFAIECKTKTKPTSSITIQKGWLEKNEYESLFLGKKNSALVFDFGDGGKRYVIISEDLFKELFLPKTIDNQ